MSKKWPFVICDPFKMSAPLYCPFQIPQSWMFLLSFQSLLCIPCLSTSHLALNRLSRPKPRHCFSLERISRWESIPACWIHREINGDVADAPRTLSPHCWRDNFVPNIKMTANIYRMLITWRGTILSPDAYMNLLHHYNNPMRQVPLSSAFYRWGKWGAEKLSHLPKAIKASIWKNWYLSPGILAPEPQSSNIHTKAIKLTTDSWATQRPLTNTNDTSGRPHNHRLATSFCDAACKYTILQPPDCF